MKFIGTIKHAQLAAITHNRDIIAGYRALARTPGTFFDRLFLCPFCLCLVQPHTKIRTTLTSRKAPSRLKLCRINDAQAQVPISVCKDLTLLGQELLRIHRSFTPKPNQRRLQQAYACDNLYKYSLLKMMVQTKNHWKQYF